MGIMGNGNKHHSKEDVVQEKGREVENADVTAAALVSVGSSSDQQTTRCIVTGNSDVCDGTRAPGGSGGAFGLLDTQDSWS